MDRIDRAGSAGVGRSWWMWTRAARCPDGHCARRLLDSFSATPVHLATNVFAIQNGGSVGHEVIGLTGPERGMQGGGFGPDA